MADQLPDPSPYTEERTRAILEEIAHPSPEEQRSRRLEVLQAVRRLCRAPDGSVPTWLERLEERTREAR